MTLGLACNFHREPYALPGFLAMATSGFFDDVVMLSSPPGDVEPDEESIELVKKSGVRLRHTTIDAGYGVIRTRLIRESKADWVMIMDCDERIFSHAPLLRCEGHEKYPETKEPNLSVHIDQPSFDQGALLKELINSAGGKDAIRLSRRHWFDAPGGFAKPCQNWQQIPDWQLRLVRNNPHVFYDPLRKMHEHLKHTANYEEPAWSTGDQYRGPFYDHFHCHYKPMDADKNIEDMETYRKLDEGLTKGMWLEHAEGVIEV